MNHKKAITSKAWVMIAFLFTLTVISNADKAIIGFASVPIIKELGLDPEQWGIVGSVFFLLYSLSAILVGGLADRIGYKDCYCRNGYSLGTCPIFYPLYF